MDRQSIVRSLLSYSKRTGLYCTSSLGWERYNDDGEVWFYRYSEDENDPDAEPELGYIDNDDEYDMVADAFDEYLDNAEFDEIVKDEE